MDIEFDPAKNEVNIAKHGISLKWASSLDVHATISDHRRDYGEGRFNAFGLIEGVPYCLAYTRRGSIWRVISLRRAHAKEYRHHVL